MTPYEKAKEAMWKKWFNMLYPITGKPLPKNADKLFFAGLDKVAEARVDEAMIKHKETHLCTSIGITLKTLKEAQDDKG